MYSKAFLTDSKVHDKYLDLDLDLHKTESTRLLGPKHIARLSPSHGKSQLSCWSYLSHTTTTSFVVVVKTSNRLRQISAEAGHLILCKLINYSNLDSELDPGHHGSKNPN